MTDSLEHRFGYHKPTSEPIIRAHERVRRVCADVAHEFEQLVPPSRELSLAITKLEEAMFWANAGIARISNYAQDSREPVDTAIDTDSRITWTKPLTNDYKFLSRNTRICHQCGVEYPYNEVHQHRH